MNCIQQQSGKNWHLYHGDSCQVMPGLPDNSIDFCIHSPPFASLFVYSDSEADMGNCADEVEFFQHYSFIIRELHRVTVPGRLCAVHCKDLPKYLNRDGEAGCIDFSGMIVQEFQEAGWTFHCPRITIWKCPVTERERTNTHRLLHKNVRTDSSAVGVGMPDYLLIFRKPPTVGLISDKPVARLNGFERYIGDPQFNPLNSSFHPSPYARTSLPKKDAFGEVDPVEASIHIWRRYAEPVWWDIDQMDTLNYKIASEEKDEKHICPLQMGVIERAVELWTNPGDVVLTPFAGVGSELVGAIRRRRKAVGCELKEAYYNHAGKNCRIAEAEADRPTLFDGVDDHVEKAEERKSKFADIDV